MGNVGVDVAHDGLLVLKKNILFVLVLVMVMPASLTRPRLQSSLPEAPAVLYYATWRLRVWFWVWVWAWCREGRPPQSQ